ncbi:ABC transporter ATP-binding protein [Neisseria leonii]|uniref:ABC transporter ATP-binding protein n=1 Tax=Neisseria leonii TaxID=2995413 RepID=UPI0030D2A8C5
MLTLDRITVAFDNRPVVEQFDFHLAAGETACLLGPSGCGKTTVLRTIAGFETPQNGRISLNGQDITATAPHKRGIGMVFQDYALFPHLTVAGNIAFGLQHWDKASRQARVAELLNLIGLPQTAARYPHQLSGGQQQRIALARALAPKPGLILLDEPFSNLDSDLRSRLAKEVRQLLKQQQTAAVMVTHDPQEAFAMADRVGIMRQGRLLQYDTPQTLYRRPTSPETAAFLGNGSLIDAVRNPDGSLQCAVGRIDCETDGSTTHWQIFLRPEELCPNPDGQPCATLLDADFQGSRYLARLQLDSGEPLLAELEELPPVGSRIALCLRHNRPAAFPRHA